MPSRIPDQAVEELRAFQDHLVKSDRILALCGAGLSVASGLSTFRGAGGFWRNYDAVSLATPTAFQRDPGLVWQFYNYRRHKALAARPNPAHHALAQLARRHDGFLTITQNVDGLSQRAGHPRQSIEFLHGSLMDLRCSNFGCNHVELDNFTDPVSPALQIDDTVDVSDARIPLTSVPATELPTCPRCKSLLRPGVVWFGESLPTLAVDRIDDFLAERQKIDLMLVIGTSAVVYPAAGYIEMARSKGARVAVINTEAPDSVASELRADDWFFQGDAGVIVPRILEPLLGEP